MLPSDPRFQGRLLRSARLLLDWSQARLACEIGSSRSTVHAVESGRLDSACPAAVAMAAALGRAGVEFMPADGRLGPGLRYTPRG
jgi:DNA-binding XRE family transcriptional regulator